MFENGEQNSEHYTVKVIICAGGYMYTLSMVKYHLWILNMQMYDLTL